MVSIAINEENIDSFRFSIVINSEEEASFIKKVSYAIKSIDITNLSDSNKLKEVTNSLILKIEYAWKMNSKRVNIMKHSKSWWNKEYRCALNNYRTTINLEN